MIRYQSSAETADTTLSTGVRLLSACFAAVLFALAFVPLASATYYDHPFISEFGPDGTTGTAFLYPEAIAVDKGSGDVYVVDTKNNRIYRFTSNGTPHNFTAGESAGKNRLTIVFPPNTQGAITSVAVAPPGSAGGTAGDIYVSWSVGSYIEANKFYWGIEVYSPTGAHLGTLDGSGNPYHTASNSPCSLAVDPAGDLYASNCGSAQTEPSHIDKYVPSANPVVNSDFDSEITNLDRCCSIQASAADLYVLGAKEGESSAAPRKVETYALSLFPGGGGSADVGGKGTELPLVVSQSFAFDEIHSTFYTPGSFSYSDNFETHQPSGAFEYDQAGDELAFVEVPDRAAVAGVAEATERVYVVNVNQAGTRNRVRIYGAAVPVAPPTAEIDPPSAVTSKSALLTGTVNSGGSGDAEATRYWFRCKPECEPPGESQGAGGAASRSIPTDGADHAVSRDVEGLQPETVYEVTLIAANAHRRQIVEDVTTFETAPKPAVTAPTVTIDQPTAVTGESAHLSGTVDPNGAGEGFGTTYRFEYSSNGLEWSALKDQGPIEGDGAQPVSAELQGLQPNTTYSVRLHARNDGGEVTSDLPNPSFATETVAPQVEIAAVTNLLPNSAQLNARVNPRNAQTTYYIEWGTADCASASCASLPASRDADAGSGGEFVSVHAQLEGLSPTATYHYRLVAKNVAGEAVTADSTFTTSANSPPCTNERTGLSAALPDCRAYEMVSPPIKSGGDIASETFRTRAAADGNAVTFVSQAAFAGSEGFAFSGGEYLSSRSPDAWSTHSITPPMKSPPAVNAFSGTQFVGYLSPDLDTGIYRMLAPNPDAGVNVASTDNLYLATSLRAGSPRLALLSDSVNLLSHPQTSSTYPMHIAFVGASRNFRTVAFEDSDNLTSNASGNLPKLYEWSNGELRLAGILPDSACGTPPCLPQESVGGAGNINTTPDHATAGTNTERAHAVSDDGSKIFFTAGSLKGEPKDAGLEGSLYVREEGTRTTQLDASERAELDPKGSGRSKFEWASADGAEVLFLSREALVDEDPLDGGISLYRWTASAPPGERLTLIQTPHIDPTHVIDVSADGAFIYLVGSMNGSFRSVYVLHAGTMRKIAEIPAPTDSLGEQGTNFAYDEARMTPDGKFLLFHSFSTLTDYDNRSVDSQCQGSENRCSELYLYSYDADEIVCPSCNPSGAPPVGRGGFNYEFRTFSEPVLNAGVSGSVTTYNNTPISSNGRLVFFSSPDALTPQDTNGRIDAYVYDVARREIRLLSSGQCYCDSVFMTASPSGDDAFFTTRQQLVRADVDNLTDLYDARVNGGIPAQNAPPPAECQGDACQAPPSPPVDSTPASSSFAGAGNVRSHHAKKRHRHHGRRRHHGHKHRHQNPAGRRPEVSK